MKQLFVVIAITLVAEVAVAHEKIMPIAEEHAFSQQHNHHQNHLKTGKTVARTGTIVEGGQAAFAAIQEIVSLLMSDPSTDWSQVNIEALRQHLIDMNNVTLHARVTTEPRDGGALFIVTSERPEITSSIRSMILAHAHTMNGSNGWSMTAEQVQDGVSLQVIGDEQHIRGLGFIGVLTQGMHHQDHHLALAKGHDPHAH